MKPRLILVLGDQLTPSLSSLRAGDAERDIVLMAEVMVEASYVGHHKKKLAFIFSAMRHFASELRQSGWRVDYIRLDDADNTGNLAGELARAMGRHGCAEAIVTEPGEWRLMEEMRQGPGTRMLDDDRFLADRHGFAGWAQTRLKPGGDTRMEQFYRLMRRKTGLLMEDGQPAGGQWNYDADNRRPAPGALGLPQPMRFQPDAITREVLDLVAARFPDNFGDLEPFWFATTRTEAQAAFAHFLRAACRNSALSGRHAVGSPLPASCGDLALSQRRAPRSAGDVPSGRGRMARWPRAAGQRGGFHPPDHRLARIRARHLLVAGAGLCTQQCARCSPPSPVVLLDRRDRHGLPARLHHPDQGGSLCPSHSAVDGDGQFRAAGGVDPHALHEWYLAVYADAFEWVELPNTVGMSQFADGGLLASKPYVASGAYIDRMSDYCGGCRYDVRAKSGARACPFNLLYWHFIARHAARLRDNPRMARVVQAWETLPLARQAELRDDAECFLATLA
jgi:deoxyribodipyrimidine photolyase-related protein